jgi:hypothetical protein
MKLPKTYIYNLVQLFSKITERSRDIIGIVSKEFGGMLMEFYAF